MRNFNRILIDFVSLGNCRIDFSNCDFGQFVHCVSFARVCLPTTLCCRRNRPHYGSCSFDVRLSLRLSVWYVYWLESKKTWTFPRAGNDNFMTIFSSKGQRSRTQGHQTSNLQKMMHIVCKCLLSAFGSCAGRPAGSTRQANSPTARTAAYMAAQGVPTNVSACYWL